MDQIFVIEEAFQEQYAVEVKIHALANEQILELAEDLLASKEDGKCVPIPKIWIFAASVAAAFSGIVVDKGDVLLVREVIPVDFVT